MQVWKVFTAARYEDDRCVDYFFYEKNMPDMVFLEDVKKLLEEGLEDKEKIREFLKAW